MVPFELYIKRHGTRVHVLRIQADGSADLLHNGEVSSSRLPHAENVLELLSFYAQRPRAYGIEIAPVRP